MKEYYRIGEVSQLFEIEISKLRYYDQIALFKPMKVDPKSSYRSYHISQFSILSQILMYRDLGIPINEIKSKIFNTNPERILDFVSEAEGKLNQQLEEIRKKKALVHAVQDDVRKAVEKENNFTCMQSPEFLVLAYDRETNQETRIQEMIELSEKAREADPERYTSASFVELLSKDDFLQGSKKRLVKGICVEKKQELEWPYSILKRRFCLHCFVEVQDESSLSEYQEVYEYIKQSNLKVTEDILQIHVMRYEQGCRSILVLELYIPVEINS